ncbi:MAG: hypothetical protein J5806_13540 [Lentisphaeria bacterium]|nr:hypothetical protein [Lentisphaeria bacterium]
MKYKQKIRLGAVLVSTLPLLLTAGCGHNAVSYFNGADLSVEPSMENGVSAHLRYGQSVHIVMKEKSKVRIALAQDLAVSPTRSGEKLEISFETGDQTNGYVVELEKLRSARPDPSDL